MHFSPAQTASLACFVLVVLWVVAAFTWGVWKTGGSVGKTVAGVFLWMVGFSLATWSGVFEAHPFPLVPVAFLLMNLGAVVFAFSRVGRRVAMGLPLWALVGFQSFRLPLELVLHAWSETGTIPVTMTWTGSNWDIVSGVVALVVAPFARHRALAWCANAIGLVLLVNVARVAVMSSPLPFAWPVEPKLMLLARFPYNLIGPVCVAGALCGHVLLTRRLITRET